MPTPKERMTLTILKSALPITSQRKKYLATQWYVSKDDLTRSLKIKNQKYIDMIEDTLRHYRNICNSGKLLEIISRDLLRTNRWILLDTYPD